MKKTLYILIFFSNASFSQIKKKAAPSDVLLKKVDSLGAVMHNMKSALNQRDTLLIKVDKLSESFKSKDSNWHEKVLPSIFAFLTVIVSSVVAYRIGIRNIRVQESNTERQANTQLSIAADNLFMSKEQLEQNTKNTLAQIRVNNISKARIEWIQSLRPLISGSIHDIAKISGILSAIEALEIENQDYQKNIKRKNDELIEVFNSFSEKAFQMRLFLNLNNQSHRELEEILKDYTQAVLEHRDNINANGIIEKARVVLKEAWEKAKSETVI